MSKKNRSAVVDYLVYLAVRAMVCVLQLLSWKQANVVAGWMAHLAYRVDKRHRLVAQENIRRAFPGQYSEREIDQMVRRCYRHFCNLLIEIVLIPRKLHVSNHKRHIHFKNPEMLLEFLLSDRPLLIVTAHFGNWELAGYYLGLIGFKTYAVAGTLDNPYLDRYLRLFRERTGQKILAKKGDFDQMNEVLATGGVMATLGDQDAGQRGLFVDFFGRPASTHKAIALMALEYNVPIVVSGAYKVGEPLKYEVVAEEIILPEDFKARPDAVKAMTQQFSTAMEKMVRRAPDQYFWLHNRWKHQPAAKKGKKAA